MDEITAQKIKDAADIVAVISDFVELHKRGVNYTGICPFHDDHTEGNFLVSKKGVLNSFLLFLISSWILALPSP